MKIDWNGSLLKGWNIKQGVALEPRVKFHSGPEGLQGFRAIWDHELQELAVIFLIQCCKELMRKEQGNGLLYVAFERNTCLSWVCCHIIWQPLPNPSSKLQLRCRDELWQRAVDVFHNISVHVVGKLSCCSQPSQELQVW